ncbi:MAG: phosphodiesterase [Candidatus Eremiobacteraeota bacterium]|nr:phosphodiesterase [Candidatus Eremiobacteraeota bacterium]
MLIAQISDMHIRRKGDLLHHMIHTGRELRRAVAAINDFVPRPNFVVATGDLVDRGKSKEYRRLRAILDQLAMPYYLVAGNHDDHAGLRDEFADHGHLPRSGSLSYVVETRPVRLVVLDTTRGRSHGGGLDAARLRWLDEKLSRAPATATLVAMHHPPFDTGIAPLDSHPLRGREELAAIVATHPQVVRMIGGHIHRACEAAFGGTVASTAPSTAHQLILDRQPSGGYMLRLERPAFVMHRWTGRALTSEIHPTTGRAAPHLRAVC